MTYTITPEQLSLDLQKNDIVLIDVRSHLVKPDLGQQAYEAGHIPGAYYLHLEKDLSGEVKKHGGNHPLPDIDELAYKLGEMGIDQNTKVVIYDERNGMFAARAWWLLYYMGHDQTYVLDGGIDGWKESGMDLTTEVPNRKASQFIPHLRTEAIVHIDEVKNRNREKSVLIDSRSRERYLGKEEPLYKKAGHIPGAKNYFWKDVFDEKGNWKDRQELEKYFKKLNNVDEIIVSCGSGISACPNFMALKMAGFKNVKLYPGSFSDWISYEENPIETEEE